MCPKPGMLLKELEGGLKLSVASKGVVEKLSKLTPDEFDKLIQKLFKQIKGCGRKNELKRVTRQISEDPELVEAFESLFAPFKSKFGAACSLMRSESAPLERRADVGEGIEMVEVPTDDEIDPAISDMPLDEDGENEWNACCVCLEEIDDSTMYGDV